MAYSQARNKATQKYLAAHKEQLRVWVQKGDLQKYKDFATENGFSLGSLVVALLDSCMDGTIPIPPKQ